VNPKHPHNRIAAWMDAARATVDTSYTRDKGRNWAMSVPHGVDGCTGNHEQGWEASGDPWLSIGPDGTAYLSALTWAHFVTDPLSDYVSLVHVHRRKTAAGPGPIRCIWRATTRSRTVARLTEAGGGQARPHEPPRRRARWKAVQVETGPRMTERIS
jgi:hypothetical protein